MTTQSNAVPGSLDSQRVAPATLAATRPLYWSVRRELWEYRSIYLAPLAVAGLFVIGFLIGMLHLRRMGFELGFHASRGSQPLDPYSFAGLLIMGTTFIVAVFYCLDALHGERRDRSILFWKSLPVSDVTSVLAKASIPLVILPLLTLAITLATQLIVLLLSAVLVPSNFSAGTPWSAVSFSSIFLTLMVHVLAVHALWYAPLYGWLLLVSAWVRRAAFLWAILPPLAIGIVEKIAFNTNYFAAMLEFRLKGPWLLASADPSNMPMHPPSLATVGQFLMSPGLWIGLGFFALFLAAAVRLRRYQGPI